MSERKNPEYRVQRGRAWRVGERGREMRREWMAPLFRAVRERGMSQAGVVILAYQRHEGWGCTANHAYQLRVGRCPAPEWLVEEVCTILGVSRESIYRGTATVAGEGATDAEVSGPPAQAAQAPASPTQPARWDVA